MDGIQNNVTDDSRYETFREKRKEKRKLSYDTTITGKRHVGGW